MTTKTTEQAIAEIRRLKTPEQCRAYADNARRLGRPAVIPECLLREAELLAAKHKQARPSNDFERRIVRDMCLIERLSGKRLSRTWPMIDRHGYVGAVERIVTRLEPSSGFVLAVKNGLQAATFEQAVLDHPKLFSPEAFASARARLTEGRKP
jgi:hypothetical protein